MPILSALFVDFDNTYINLKNKHGLEVAEQFANNPAVWLDHLKRTYEFDESPPIVHRHLIKHIHDRLERKFDEIYDSSSKKRPAASWLSWLRRSSPSPSSEVESGARRIVLRKVYLNPNPFWKYRKPFMHAGCEVVDCPSLTLQNKSSADIRMALEITDALSQQDPPFGEFIILSGDADFTPVLFRLRQHGRRIVIITASHTAQAYSALADEVIGGDQLVDVLLRDAEPIQAKDAADRESTRSYDENSAMAVAEQSNLNGRVSESVPIDEVDRIIGETLKESSEPVRGAKLAELIRAKFKNKDWFGYTSFRALMEDRVPKLGLKYGVQGTSDYAYDPKRHQVPFD